MCCYGVDRRICYGECYDDLRDVYETLVLHGGLDLLGQGAGDLGGIAAADVAVDALPLGNPGLLGVGDGDEAFEDLGGARLDGLGGVLELEEGTVGAARLSEALFYENLEVVSTCV